MSVLKPHSKLIAGMHRLLDGALIAVGLYAITVVLEQEWANRQAVAAGAAVAIFLIMGEVQRLYASWRLRSLDEEFRAVIMAWAMACAGLIVLAFLFKVSSSYSRVATMTWFLTTPAALIFSRLAVRLALRAARSGGANMRTVAIAGSREMAEGILAKLQQRSDSGLNVLGVFEDRSTNRLRGEGLDPVHIAGDLDILVERARTGSVDYVFIALPLRAEERIISLVNRLADTTASVYVVPDLFVFDLMSARLTMLDGLPAVSVYESPFDGLSGWIKRAEDLIIGSTLLLVSALPMILVGIGLKLTKAESVFFRQQRYGLNGRVVRVWKFRTMTVSEDGSDVVQARVADPRITPFGAFLRKTSLDELPQLFNVITGEMSLVGPRPHAVRVNEEFRRLIHGYMLRHKVKPGITGWAQVNGWHGEDTVEKMQQRVDHDLAYLQNWSLWLDLKILGLTVATVFARRSAGAAR